MQYNQLLEHAQLEDSIGLKGKGKFQMNMKFNQIVAVCTIYGALQFLIADQILCQSASAHVQASNPVSATLIAEAGEAPPPGFKDKEACPIKPGEPIPVKKRSFSGNCSWYGIPFHGRTAACGSRFDMNKLTCAHKSLPCNTKLLLENPKNGKSIVVKVTDRGPYVKNRILDLSREAARRLDMLLGGTAFLNVTIIAD